MGNHGGDADNGIGYFVDSGADAMTFDMQAAQICAVTLGADTRIALKAALDEIERLQKTLVEERAHVIEYNPNRTIEWTHEQAKERAREQLRQEGKL